MLSVSNSSELAIDIDPSGEVYLAFENWRVKFSSEAGHDDRLVFALALERG